MTVGTSAYRPYLPRIAVEWARRGDDPFLALPGSLLSLDISGFTALSERLQGRGRAGAEELILLISGVFEGLIGIAERHGGDVLKFRGDALLIVFTGRAHEERASRAAAEMQWLIERTGETTSSVGPVRLRMSSGVHSGDCHFFVVGSTHRELVVTGPAASATVRLESAAEAGEILVSAATAAALDAGWLGGERDGAWLLALPEEAVGAPADPAEEPEMDAALLEAFVPAPLRSHLALEAGEGEHRQVTAAFVKFGGVDESLVAGEVAAVHERLARLGEVVGDAAAELGITWLESDVDVDGGKLYLVAGAPSAAGNEEERMLRALRKIVDGDVGLELRAGVNRGPAFAGDIGAASRRTYAVMGDTVNLAARLTARAEPGQILASADVLDRAQSRYETTHQPFLMKGKERPVTAYSVGVAVGTREVEPAQRLPLVGREEQVAAIAAAVAAARMRQPQLVELVGEPGIGKSRLAEEATGLAVGFQQLVTRCEQYETSTPFFAFRPLLRSLAGITPEQGAAEAGAQLTTWVQAVMPDLAPWLPLLAVPFDAEVAATPEVDAIDAQFRRDKLHEVAETFMTRVLMMPTLILVEDAHWADDASGFFLRHLAASTLPRPWLLLVTRRPGGQPIAPEGSGTVLELAPLSDGDAAMFALTAAGDVPLAGPLVEALTERAAGNPLFLRELVSAARSGGSLETLPETVETLLTARIDTLDPGDRLLLRYASVLGASFDLGLLSEILAEEPVDPGDLERWGRLGEFVERAGGEEIRFRHDLFRATAYQGLSFRRRREIHGRVADALERRAGDAVDEAAGLLSLHFLEAGRFDRAWTYAVAAGRRAQAVYANVIAAELYERALRAAERLPGIAAEEVLPIWESLGDVTMLFAAYDRAAEAFERSLELAGEDVVAATRLMRKVGVALDRLGRRDDALRWFDRALAELADRELGPDGIKSRVGVEIAYAGVLYYQSRYDECIQWAEQAAAHAEEVDDKSALGHALYILSLAAAQAGRPDARYHERAIAIYEETGELIGYANLLNNLGLEAYEGYRWDEALEHYRRGAELSAKAGDVTNVARIRINEADVLGDRGLFDEAESLLVDVMRVWRAANYPLAIAITSSNLGRILGRAGRFDEAQELLEEARAAFRSLGNDLWVAEASVRIADVLVLAGEHGAALARAAAALDELEGLAPPPALTALAERILGYALVQGRRNDEARPHFERSLEIARGADAAYEVALTLKAMADTGLAGPEAAAEAQEILDRLGVVALPRVPLP